MKEIECVSYSIICFIIYAITAGMCIRCYGNFGVRGEIFSCGCYQTTIIKRKYMTHDT